MTATTSLLNRWTNGPMNRALLASFLSTAMVLRKTQVADTSGGFTHTWPTTGPEYPCMFKAYPVRPLEREFTQRVQAIKLWEFHFLLGTDIRVTDRLQVGTRTFEIIGAGEGNSDTFLNITAVEIL